MTLKYIFHLSDLHIRNGDASYCRFNEYDYVFKNTVSSIKSTIITHNLAFNDFIIIITGDIFHNKNNIGNYGIFLFIFGSLGICTILFYKEGTPKYQLAC